MSAQLGGSVMSLNVRTSCHNSTGSELDLVDNLKLSAGNGDIPAAIRPTPTIT